MTTSLPDLPEKFELFRRHVLDPVNQDQLLGYLKKYTTDPAYTGAHFHDLTYSGPSHPDHFDIADVASLSLLSVTLNGPMARELMKNPDLSTELAREPDRDLADLTDIDVQRLESDEGLNGAWRLIRHIHGVGPTRTSKLLARKRPRLVPIWDSVISRVLGLDGTRGYWTAFHRALTADSRALDERLSILADKAGVADRYSRLRVLDILAWMYGRDEKNYENEILTELDSEPDDE